MKKFELTRRGLLGGGLGTLAAGAGLSTFGGLDPLFSLAAAGAHPDLRDHYYIFCYMSGGWDQLLTLDPKDPDVFSIENIPYTLTEPGYEQLQEDMTDHPTRPFLSNEGVLVGPYIGDVMNYSDRMAIVRGMSMETLSHETGRRRFITGKSPSGLLARGSSISTWLAGTLGPQDIVPNLAIQVESYNVNLPPSASAIGVDSVPDLIRALQPSSAMLPASQETQVDHLLVNASACPKAQKSPFLVQAEGSRRGAADLIRGDLAGYFDFGLDRPEMEFIRSHFGAAEGATLTTAQAAAATAVQALTLGISRVASIRVAGGLDTHGMEWQSVQGPRQEAGFNLIARMAEILESREFQDTGDTWLDHTTIVAFSEFSRTAMVNPRGGRDHALSNSCMLLGGGIRGGQAIGKSADVGMGPTTTNLRSGEPDPGGEVIKPEHVRRSLMEIGGITEDIADLRVDPIEALVS